LHLDSLLAGSTKYGTGTKILCKETIPAQSKGASNRARYAQQLIEKEP
jgi:hypothetical protein